MLASGVGRARICAARKAGRIAVENFMAERRKEPLAVF